MKISRITGILAFGVFGLAVAAVAAFFNPVFVLSIAMLSVLILFLAVNLDLGMLVLVFFFPYLGMVIDFGQFEALRQVPYLGSVNAPFVDLFGLVLFAAWGIHVVVSIVGERSGKISARAFDKVWNPSTRLGMTVMWQLPHFKSYLLLWLSGLVSLGKASPLVFTTSLKYFARPFTFAYVVFFVPVVHVLS